MRIVTLSENAVSEDLAVRWDGLVGEWGLSILVVVDDHRILLDAGASISTVRNAESMGIDLFKVDKIVLSHGHWDHTGACGMY
jgi:7,8-dihydropterin-6-yl-methyl-4-(beta-D-ribofuranosyl)aminobenzene 5'-phosphate synthase